MGREHGFCIKIQPILGINNPSSILQLLARKPLPKFCNEANSYNGTLHFHYLHRNIPFITNTHGIQPYYRGLVMDPLLVALEIKNGILNIGGYINLLSC